MRLCSRCMLAHDPRFTLCQRSASAASWHYAQWSRFPRIAVAAPLAEPERQRTIVVCRAVVASHRAPAYDSLPEANARLRSVLEAHRAPAPALNPFGAMALACLQALRRWRWHSLPD